MSSGLAAVPLSAGAEPAAGASVDGLRLLFVGNSLTYTNDLPGMLATMLQWAGTKVDLVTAEALPDYGLPDHWQRRKTRRALSKRRWDVVILQQGPSATEGRPSLLSYSRLFAGEIRESGARPGLFMVWPSIRRRQDFAGVSDSYLTAARETDSLLFPVGEAWLAAWRRDADLPLYGADGYHPSPLGSYLAALVFFEQLAKQDPRSLPPRLPLGTDEVALPDGLARLLQDSAVEANARFARR